MSSASTHALRSILVSRFTNRISLLCRRNGRERGGGNITARLNGWSKALNAFAITTATASTPQ